MRNYLQHLSRGLAVLLSDLGEGLVAGERRVGGTEA